MIKIGAPGGEMRVMTLLFYLNSQAKVFETQFSWKHSKTFNFSRKKINLISFSENNKILLWEIKLCSTFFLCQNKTIVIL